MNDDTIGKLTRDEAIAFSENNGSFYAEKWGTHSDSTFKGWNWAAAIFGVEWMAYRKMYFEAVLSYVAVSLVSVAFNLDGTLWSYAIRIIFGIFGNALYYKKAVRTLHKVDALNNSQDRLTVLSHKGGVSILSVVLLILLEVAFVMLSFAN